MNIDKTKTVCFSGHRILPFGANYDSLYESLKMEIQKSIHQGYDTFIFGGAMGFDLMCGEILFKFKNLYKITIMMIIPTLTQSEKFTVASKEKYDFFYKNCDKIFIISEEYYENCYKDRNQFMVDNSSKLITYYQDYPHSGTYQTICMAEKALNTIVYVS